ncbi:molybdopterin synthase sulfur carrier subunit [Cimex lectularius]|uniref:Molybdopterin synthase sulfur carrier subunit n=1 Tax=Cimex lectularius TaxID=79782 RepID=A0A8I6TJS7_CIMLE|nr:molybdopterin synthase sulfur carrier subunit [Cimex lectularius]
MVKVKLLFFAKARELSGKKEALLDLPQSSTSYKELLEVIVKEHSLDLIKANVILAQNEEYIETGEVELKEGDEIAVIPPLSGG